LAIQRYNLASRNSLLQSAATLGSSGGRRERQVAANTQTKPTDLGCESADRQLPSTSTIAMYY